MLFLSSLSLKLSLILFRSEHVSITDFLNLAKNPYLTGVRSILSQGLQSLVCLEVRTCFSCIMCTFITFFLFCTVRKRRNISILSISCFFHLFWFLISLSPKLSLVFLLFLLFYMHIETGVRTINIRTKKTQPRMIG